MAEMLWLNTNTEMLKGTVESLGGKKLYTNTSFNWLSLELILWQNIWKLQRDR